MTELISTIESQAFFFDDEPLESILYGKQLSGPTIANLYLAAQDNMKMIFAAYEDGNIQDVIQKASELAMRGHGISMGMCYKLAEVLTPIVPNYPNPIIIFDLSPLKQLIELLWGKASEMKDETFQTTFSSTFYRWYEHHGRYEEARQIISKVIQIYQNSKNRPGEAIMTNNFAFEYLLEKRWEEAIPLFEECARVFNEMNRIQEYANARANYWICKFAIDDLEDIEKIETELKELAQTLSRSGLWHERKPLILLAKIEERRGNIEEAINLVKQAIESTKNSNTRYSEEDGEYWKMLKSINRYTP